MVNHTPNTSVILRELRKRIAAQKQQNRPRQTEVGEWVSSPETYRAIAPPLHKQEAKEGQGSHRERNLSAGNAGALRRVFHHIAQVAQAVAHGIGQGEVLLLAGIGTAG